MKLYKRTSFTVLPTHLIWPSCNAKVFPTVAYTLKINRYSRYITYSCCYVNHTVNYLVNSTETSDRDGKQLQ